MDLTTLQNTPSYEWPEDAGETFLEYLSNPQADPADRLVAADLAGDFVVINDELAEALLEVLSNPEEPEDLRACAAISFGPALESGDTDEAGEFGDLDDEPPLSPQMFRKVCDTLRRLYLDAGVPKIVRRRILEASVRAHQDWLANAVRAAYTSGDSDWKLTAVFAMGFVRGFDKEILASLDDENPEVRYHAISAAGDWQIDGAWPHVAALLKAKNADKNLLLAAIEASAFIRPKEAADLLLPLANSPDEDIAATADEALAIAEGYSEMEDDESFR